MTGAKTRRGKQERTKELEQEVLSVLENSTRTFWTLQQLAEKIGVSDEEVRVAIARRRDEIKRLTVPTNNGDSIYFLISRRLTLRNRLAIARQYIMKSVP